MAKVSKLPEPSTVENVEFSVRRLDAEIFMQALDMWTPGNFLAQRKAAQLHRVMCSALGIENYDLHKMSDVIPTIEERQSPVTLRMPKHLGDFLEECLADLLNQTRLGFTAAGGRSLLNVYDATLAALGIEADETGEQ